MSKSVDRYCKLSDVLSGRPPRERVLVVEKLGILSDCSPTDYQARINFENECRLLGTTWERLIDAILEADFEARSIRSAIRATMRAFILQGPPTRTASTTVLGRAITLSAMARSFAADRYFGTPSAAHSHIRSMRNKPLSYLRKLWTDLRLGRYLMWSTFNKNGGRPFADVDESAQRVRGSLGLSRIDQDLPLLLLEYLLPLGEIARFPTVCEAYSGDDWIYYFRPASDLEEDHGWTLPWDDSAEQSAGLKRKPELVHLPIKGKQLAAALREISDE